MKARGADRRAGSFLHAALLAVALCGTAAAEPQGKPPAKPIPSEAQQTQAAPAPPSGSPVVVRGRVLFRVQERIYSFSPQDRANAIAEKVEQLYRDSALPVEQIRVEEQENTTEIVAGESVLMAITERDAQAAGTTRQALGQQYAAVIRATVEELRQEYSVRTIAYGLLWATLATVLLLLIVRLSSAGSRRLRRILAGWQGTRIRGLRLQRLELLSAAQITRFFLLVVKLVRLTLLLVLFYVYLTVVFGFFPWTRGYASVLLQHVLTPLRAMGQAVADYLPNLFFVVVILVVAYYLIKLIKFGFHAVETGAIELPGFYPEWAEPTYKITRFLVIAFTAVVVFPYLPGATSPAFQGISLFLGLLVSLGSASAVSNIVAGVVLTYTRAFQVGDRVKVGEALGDVVEKTLLVTRLRTIKNVDVSIPNSMVLSSHIVNFSSSAQEHGLILHTTVTIGYDAPWRRVHELLTEAALATEHILREPAPFVLQTSLNDFYVSYELNAVTGQPAKMAAIYSQLHQNIQDKFHEAGVEIMSPHYSALRDGNQTAIPAELLPKEYVAPSFRVESQDKSE